MRPSVLAIVLFVVSLVLLLSGPQLILAEVTGTAVARFRFDGSENTLILNGAASLTTGSSLWPTSSSGQEVPALLLNGGHAAIPSLNQQLYNHNFSISVWANPQDRNRVQHILSDWSYPWSFLLQSRGSFNVELRRNINSQGSDPNQGLVGVDGGDAVSGQWTHIGFTYDHLNGVATLYTNGNLVSSSQTTYANHDIQSNNHQYWHLGLKADSGVTYYGLLADVRIYSDVLSPQDVQFLASQYSQTPPTTIIGDPQFVGLQGQVFQVHGYPSQFFNLISQPNFQLNAKFVYLATGRCYYNDTACWTHPGTYLGQLGFNFGLEHSTIRVESGSHELGMRMFVGGVEKFPSIDPFKLDSVSGRWQFEDNRVTLTQFELGNINVQFPNKNEFMISTDDWQIGVTNSDDFFNLAVTWKQENFMKIGQTLFRVPEGVDSLSHISNLPYPSLPLHGFVGQTWKNVEYAHGKKYEADAVDYMLAGRNIFGNDFLFNQFQPHLLY